MSATELDTPNSPLFQSERQREILSLTVEHERVEVAELAERFKVTTETIRRDLSDLQKQRLVRRVHGGAVPWETSAFEPLLSVRNDLQDDEKRRMANRAIEELPDSGSIIIDSGSTLIQLAKTIPPTVELQVVTNSLYTAQILAEHAAVDVIVLGGKVRKNTLAMVDASAVAAVEQLKVDTLFISCDGASPTAGLTTPYRGEAALKKAMIAAARRVVLLADHSKFAKDHFIKFAEWTDIDVLITNTDLASATVKAIEASGTTVVLT